jgi:nicotinic acid mononucleotide adenylyltransferase
MKKHGLIVGGVNPVHYGHIALIETGLKEVEHIDFMVGNKSLYVLPYEIRAKALKTVVHNLGLEDRVSVPSLPKGNDTRLKDYETSKYSALILGSDVLNHFHPSEKIHRPQDEQFFSKFPNLVVLEREGIPITDEVREYIYQTWNIKVYSPVTPIAAKVIRQDYRDGKDVSSMMPEYVWEQIKPHAELFHTTSH